MVFRDLVRTADVLVENYRPGVLDFMGLGFEALSAIRPELIYTSTRGYGTGPYENRRVFDQLAEATAGTAAAQGGEYPENIRMIIFGKVTALTTARGVTGCFVGRSPHWSRLLPADRHVRIGVELSVARCDVVTHQCRRRRDPWSAALVD